MNERLLHPGPDKVFPEVRCQYWVLCGRQAIKHHQWTCNGFRRWRGKLVVLNMEALPPAHLRLLKPPFFSVRVNCFGPYVIKFGRCCEKWWGGIFKCLTTQCVHLNLLNADAFLLVLRQFVAQRGTPFNILSDQGTNFRGADIELRESFTEMEPQLQEELTEKQIKFCLNPPVVPHFGGTWKREIQFVKKALQVVIDSQPVQEG